MGQTILRMLKSYAVRVFLQYETPHDYNTTYYLCATLEAKINGKQLLNNISMMISKLNLSFGFQMEIEERAKTVGISSCLMAT